MIVPYFSIVKTVFLYLFIVSIHISIVLGDAGFLQIKSIGYLEFFS